VADLSLDKLMLQDALSKKLQGLAGGEICCGILRSAMG